VRLFIFDTLSMPDKAYEERVKFLKELQNNGALPSFSEVVDSVKCRGILGILPKYKL
jgi:hypothetical protein